MKDFDLEDLFVVDASAAKAEAAPVVQSSPVAATLKTVDHGAVDHVAVESQSNSRVLSVVGVLFGMLASLILGVAIGAAMFRGGSDDTVDPDVEPVSGAYVAIFYQDADMQKYSDSQREFLNSVNTANWLEEHKVNWKKIDVDDAVDRLEPPFPIMAEKHRSKEPWIVIAAGKKFASEPIESNEQAMKLLQKWVK